MQFRRMMLIPLALLFLAVGIAPIFTQDASAEVVVATPSMGKYLKKSRAIRHDANGLLLDPQDGDTVWVGHIVGNNDIFGGSGAGPFHIGRTDEYVVDPPPPFGHGNKVKTHPGAPIDKSNNAYWDWDRWNAGEADSLQGWWPLTCPYGSVGGSNVPDYRRAFWGLDYGNVGNYVINQGAPKRTFGVRSYWHRDGGGTQAPVPQAGIPAGQFTNARSKPQWTPLGGSFSAWCGLRAHGDLAAQDATAQGGTGNYHNSDVLDYAGDNGNNQVGAVDIVNGTDHLFPGYGSQWDQLMYRDYDLTGVAAGSGASISFKYTTDLSVGAFTASNISTGWFDKDPLSDARLAPPTNTATSDGNFISAAADAVIDSFMVYVGAPVEKTGGGGSPNPEPDQPRLGDDYVGSTGDSYEIHNEQHRWFSEVIKIDQVYREILSESGVNDGSAGVIIVVPGATIDAIRAAGGNKVRLVFRVKTNRGFDDADNYQTSFDSNGEGAAIVDDVGFAAGAFTSPAGDGDFEQATDINNNTATLATAAWKTTGKPPLIYYHRHDLAAGLPYEDPCGTIGAANRQCNMRGGIMTSGNHDNKEKPGGVFGKNVQDNQKWLASPTINLMSNGNGLYNAQGIDTEIADVSSDLWLHFDVYTNGLQFGTTGNGLRVGWQSYPALQANGVVTWGEMVKTIFFSAYDGAFGCGNDFAYAPAGALALTDGLIITTNGSGIPDSVRAYVEQVALCFRRPVNAAQCSPDIDNVALNGIYIDNASMGFIDGAEPPQLSLSVWDIYNSSFPWNDAIAFGTANFDTTTAHPRSGFQTGLQTGDLTRCTIPGDSIIVNALGNNTRVDLVFRILPGPGNYITKGNKSSALRKRPDGGSGAGNAASAGEAAATRSFWGSYLADRGQAGTPGGHPGGVWSPHVWNSARCDTAEGNLFPAEGVGNRTEWQLTPGFYVSSYHESEIVTGAARASLGICKNRCFLIDNTPGSALDNTNVTCTSVPAWVNPVSTSGYNAGEGASYGCAAGQTKEYSKILPDGQFTPGTHVQYFWRKGDATTGVLQFAMPDTFLVFPQPFAGADFDGLRWFHFGVLPDLWKDDYPDGGLGLACMLVVDNGNRRADELSWVQSADSIGLTASTRRGAHNGWSARPDHDITEAITHPSNTGLAVAAHGGQAGTVWDLYQVMGGESNVPAGLLGSRASGDCTGENGVSAKKQSTHGPDDEVLRGVYRVLIFLMTDLGQQAIGPVPDKADQDVPLIEDFMDTAGGTDQPRGVMMIGRDFTTFNNADHPGFTAARFGGDSRTDDYRGSSGSTDDVPDLIPTATLNSTGRIYGVFGPCFFFNDALDLDAGAAADGAEAAVFYENTGAGDPWIAGIYWPANAPAGHEANTFLGAWTYGFFGGFGGRFDLSVDGQHDFTLQALSAMFGDLCSYNPTPVGVGDGPNSGKAFVNFMNLKSENPMRTGSATISFAVAKTEQVELKIYDVSGRLVKTLVNKQVTAGETQTVLWNGTDDHGKSVARGVYFYQLRTPSFVSNKKLAVLKNF